MNLILKMNDIMTSKLRIVFVSVSYERTSKTSYVLKQKVLVLRKISKISLMIMIM